MVMSEVNEAERWYGRLFMYRLAHAVFSGEPDETLLGTLEGDGLSRLVAAQWAFLQNHLLRWLGEYAADLHEDAPDSLYDRAAQALALYAAEDAFFLREWDRAQ